MAALPASPAALQRYLAKTCGQHNCLPCCGAAGRTCVCTVNCLRFLFVAPAAESGLWCELYRSGFVYDFGLGSLETQLAPFVQLPAYRFVVGADPDAVTWSFAPDYPTERLSRLQFLALIARGAVCPYGTWTQPAGVRSDYRLRAVTPASGASVYDGVPYAALAGKGGLLDAQGFVEIQNLGGPLGNALGVRGLRRAAPGDPPLDLFGAQQLLHACDGKGGNVAVPCDPSRTVVGLNRVHSAVLLLMRLGSMSFADAVVYFVDVVCRQSTAALALDPAYATTTWVTYFTVPTPAPAPVFPGRCFPARPCCSSQSFVQVLGNSAADGPTTWQQVVSTLGIVSLSNPARDPAQYTLSDVAQVFVQCLCTPDFLVTTADPWARLAAMQTFYLSPYCDVVFGRALGAFGSDASASACDLVQSLFEYRGDAFGADLVYAWWRFASYQDEAYESRPLASTPPPDPALVTSVTGPFYVRDSCNVWTALSYTPSSGDVAPPGALPTGALPTGRVQLNVAYNAYTLEQMAFAAAPLCAQNPCGGRWPFLGAYDVSTGLVTDVTTPLWGPALGGLYPGLVAVGQPLPAALPQTVGSPPAPMTRQFFVVSGAAPGGTPANAGGDPNAPATVVRNGWWLHYDPALSPPWAATDAWPDGSTVELSAVAASVWKATCLWDRSVPPSGVGLQFALRDEAFMAPG